MKAMRRDALSEIGAALTAGLSVPTDTMITDDIPLLLSKLSQLPPVDDADGRNVDAEGATLDPA